MIALMLSVLLGAAAPRVEQSATATTRLYIRTTPAGAEISVDGAPSGKSNRLLKIEPGPRKIVLQLEGHHWVVKVIEAREGQITRMVIGLDPAAEAAAEPAGDGTLSHVDGTAEMYRSIQGSGHAVRFTRPPEERSVVAIEVFGSRYGLPEPPAEDFHASLLDEKQRVIARFGFPYATFERGDHRWRRLAIPATAVPETFSVAFDFNPHQTKGVYLGLDTDAATAHSYVGLPEQGFTRLDEPGEWMIRVVLGPPQTEGLQSPSAKEKEPQ